MELEVTRTDADVTISVSGFVDVENGYNVYRAAIAEAEQGFSVVTLDLAGVEFMDSVGLGMLIRARDELARDFESRLVLHSPSEYVTRLLQLTGLQGQFSTTT